MKNLQYPIRVRGWRTPLAAFGLWLAASVAFAVQIEAPSKSPKQTKPASPSRVELKSKANQMAAGVRAAEAALSPAELTIAQRVEVGRMPCELGAFVTVEADARMPGYFDVAVKKFKFRMVPVVSSTGAIRLEDPAAGAVWLQLSNKSMLMNHKTGSRIADACMTPMQVAVADAMLKSPPPSLLEPLPVAQIPASPAMVTPPMLESAVR